MCENRQSGFAIDTNSSRLQWGTVPHQDPGRPLLGDFLFWWGARRAPLILFSMVGGRLQGLPAHLPSALVVVWPICGKYVYGCSPFGSEWPCSETPRFCRGAPARRSKEIQSALAGINSSAASCPVGGGAQPQAQQNGSRRGRRAATTAARPRLRS